MFRLRCGKRTLCNILLELSHCWMVKYENPNRHIAGFTVCSVYFANSPWERRRGKSWGREAGMVVRVTRRCHLQTKLCENGAMQILSTKYNKYKCNYLRDFLATLHTNTHSHRRVWRRIVWGGERRSGRRKRILASSVLGRVRVVPGEKHKNANVFWDKYGISKICKYAKFHLEREGVVRREEW